jgi:TPR repeat protein
MMKSLLKPIATALLLSLPLLPMPTISIGQEFSLEDDVPDVIRYPRKQRPIFVPRADGKRDQFQHLLYLAESPPTARKRAKAYRYLAEILGKVGRNSEAMRAYEAGALQGDGPSATEIMQAHAAGRFKPNYLSELIELVYLPRAKAGGTGGPMLMAKLVGSGKVKGVGSSSDWLQLAASRGSTEATLQLAEGAERRGKIASAAKLYASIDKMSKLDRALRQARVHLLGEDTKPNGELALAWLDHAATIDAAAAGKQAESLYRREAGSEDVRAKLLEVALASGYSPKGGGGGGYGARLRAAATADERAQLLVEMTQAADAGDAGAALALAQEQLVQADPALEESGYVYLLKAVEAGLEPAVTDAAARLAGMASDSPRAASLLAALTKSADGGSVPAMWALVDLYAFGGAIAADPEKSLSYLQAAADAGHAEAQLRLGLHFAQQQADPEKVELARHYLEAAADQGSAPAKAYLAGFKPAA